MKRIYLNHRNGILIFTFIMTVLTFISLISNDDKGPVIGPTILCAIAMFVTAYIFAAFVDFIKLMLQKTLAAFTKQTEHEEASTELKTSSTNTNSTNVLVEQKKLETHIPHHDVTNNPSMSISDENNLVPLAGKPIRCASCGNMTSILNRVQFNDGSICNDCLKKLDLKKNIELDLWAKDHSWKDVTQYH